MQSTKIPRHKGERGGGHGEQTWLTVLLLLLLAACSAPILYGIVRYAVNIPFQDEWSYISLLKNSSRGILTLSDLLKPKNSYRQLVPNLLFVALGYTTKLNLKWEMVLTFSIVAHTGWMWTRLLRTAGAIPAWIVGGISFFLFSILFTASQYENWVLGMQFVYFFPVYCLTLCIRVAYSEMRMIPRAVIIFLISFLCTLSSANGVLCWLSLLPLAFRSDFRKSRIWSAASISLVFFSIAAYFFDYGHTGNLLAPVHGLPSVRNISAFLIRLAGNGFGTRPDFLMTDIFGYMTLIGWLVCCGIMVWLLPDRQTIGTLLPWFVLGLYGLGNAFLITVGRSSMGLDQAFAPRYTGFTLFLCLSVTILPVIAYFRRPDSALLRSIAWGMSLWMMAATGLKWARHGEDFERMRHFTKDIALGKAGLLVSRHIPYSEQKSLVFFPSAEFAARKSNLGRLTDLTNWLDSNRMLRPSLITEPYLTTSRVNPMDLKGVFSGVSSMRDTIFAKGRVEVGDLLQLRQAVVITSLDATGRRRFVGIDNSGQPEWTAAFPASRLKEDDTRLDAWLLDGETGTFRAINGSHDTPD